MVKLVQRIDGKCEGDHCIIQFTNSMYEVKVTHQQLLLMSDGTQKLKEPKTVTVNLCGDCFDAMRQVARDRLRF